MQGEVTEPVETIEEFVARVRITADIELLSTDDETWTYKVSLVNGASSLTLDYEDFDEHSAIEIVCGVLDEAASDALSIENSKNLWEWCQEFYGLEPHNPVIPNPEESYLVHQHRARQLKKFLGDDNYSQLLFGVERVFELD